MELEDAIRELQHAVRDLRDELTNERAARERMFRPGKVAEVDAAKQLYRQEIGVDKDGNPVKGPWVPYSQIAGGRKTHSPPSVGQQMMLISPDGDFSQGFGVPFTWSKEQASPSTDPNTDVDQRGDVKDVNDGKSRVISAGGVTLKISAAGVEITGGALKHDGRNIGKTHKHVNVQPGGGQSGETA